MFKKRFKYDGDEGDTRIVLNKEEEIRKLEHARMDVVRQLEERINEYAELLAVSKSDKKVLTERKSGKVGKAANDFKGIK